MHQYVFKKLFKIISEVVAKVVMDIVRYWHCQDPEISTLGIIGRHGIYLTRQVGGVRGVLHEAEKENRSYPRPVKPGRL